MTKFIRQGYYWPNISLYVKKFMKKCDKCQLYANIFRQPQENLLPISNSWSFTQWEIDLIGPLPTSKGQIRFAMVVVDYFTKWAESELLATITEAKITNLVWRNIVYRFVIPYTIITDDEK